MHFLRTILVLTAFMAMVCHFAGCGTTRSSDTTRTATEQLLISDAVDRAVEQIDVRMLEGQAVYLDEAKIGSTVVDRDYLISSLRQHMLASGCVLKEKREDADFVLEARTGALGTDRNDLLFGIPATNVPQVVPLTGVPAAIPEIPFAKRSLQRAVAKLAVFAYHRETGEPVWQSGLAMSESTSQGFWVLGAGPFQKGTIYNGTKFPGQGLKTKEHNLPLAQQTRVLDRAVFSSPHDFSKPAANEALVASEAEPANSQPEGVKQAAYEGVAAPTVINQAYAELPVVSEPKRPGPPPPADQKVKALPLPNSRGTSGAAGL